MATITKRVLKNGTIAYSIQAKVKDRFYNTTWRRPKELKENEAKRELELFKNEYERKVRAGVDVKNENITFEECAAQWLTIAKSSMSKSYYHKSVDMVTKLNSYFGKKILKTICLRDVEKYFIDLNNKEMIVNKVRLIKPLDEILKINKIKDICTKCGFTKTTFQVVRKGELINIKTANAICENYNLNFKTYFENNKSSKPYELETKLKYKRTLSSIFNFAVKHEYINKNYAASIFIGKLITGEKREKDILSEEETKALNVALDKEPSLKKRLALTTLLYMGIRVGELSGLEWKDIDFQNRTMQIERSVCFIPHLGEYTKPPKTKNSKRKLNIPNKVYDLLVEYKKEYDYEKKRLGTAWVNTDRIICRYNGNTTVTDTYSNWLTDILIKNGIRKVTPHSLRHTCITTLLRAKIPPQIVSKWAGHSSTSVTLNTYAHFLPEDKNVCADMLNYAFN